MNHRPLVHITIYELLASNSQQKAGRDKRAIVHEVSICKDLDSQVAELSRQMHHMQLLLKGKTQSFEPCSQMNDLFSNTYNEEWRNVPNLS